jgi:DNA-binding response OmpR family regulator
MSTNLHSPRQNSILVVDDDELFRRMLRSTLERAGYSVVEASDGDEAIRLVRAQPPSAVVLDLIMPNREGLETLSELGRLGTKLPVIAISGGGRLNPESYLSMARGLGAAETLEKPFEPGELLEKVRALLPAA